MLPRPVDACWSRMPTNCTTAAVAVARSNAPPLPRSTRSIAAEASTPALRADRPLAARSTGVLPRSVITSTDDALFWVPMPIRSTRPAGPPDRSAVASVTTAM